MNQYTNVLSTRPTTIPNRLVLIDGELMVFFDGELIPAGAGGQDAGYEWTPTEIVIGESIGLFSYTDPGLIGVEVLTITVVENNQGYDIEFCHELVEWLFPNLTELNNDAYFYCAENDALETLSMPLLESVADSFYVTDCPVLVNLDLSSLISVNGVFRASTNNAIVTIDLPNLVTVDSTMYFDNNPLLETLSMPSLESVGQIQCISSESLTDVDISSLLNVTTNVTFAGCALSQASVDGVLAACVQAGVGGGQTIDLSGGTNAIPGVQGLLDKATLEGNGANVVVNS